jgi:hypothetical protein
MENKIDRDAEARKKKKEGLLLFVIFGGLIVALIAMMFFIDYYNAPDNASGQKRPHDAADQ